MRRILTSLLAAVIVIAPIFAGGAGAAEARFLFGNHIDGHQVTRLVVSRGGEPVPRPGLAEFLYHTGVNGEDHPVWLLNRRDIPQPGSFTHFHWISTDSTDPRAGQVPAPCDQDTPEGLEAAGATGTMCPGWLLQLTAIRAFAFEHGGEVIPVRPGTDDATHLNIVTNYRAVGGVVPTR